MAMWLSVAQIIPTVAQIIPKVAQIIPKVAQAVFYLKSNVL